MLSLPTCSLTHHCRRPAHLLAGCLHAQPRMLVVVRHSFLQLLVANSDCTRGAGMRPPLALP